MVHVHETYTAHSEAGTITVTQYYNRLLRENFGKSNAASLRKEDRYAVSTGHVHLRKDYSTQQRYSPNGKCCIR